MIRQKWKAINGDGNSSMHSVACIAPVGLGKAPEQQPLLDAVRVVRDPIGTSLRNKEWDVYINEMVTATDTFMTS